MTSAAQPAAADLVALSSDDPLAPFVLRPDKRHVFSRDGRAVVGYAVRLGTALVGGDPVGDSLSWPDAIRQFVAVASAAGLRMAVLGAGERARELWAEHGLSSLAIGRDVVVRPADFDLVGRRFRNLRQAVQRTRNAGVTVQCELEGQLPEAARTEVESLLKLAGRDHDRGFSMILGGFFDGSQPDAVIALARARSGRLVAAQRYLRAGPKDLSLDVPVRTPDAPNGVDERIVAEVVSWASAHGVTRVSLSFAPFPDLLDRHRRHPMSHRVAGLLLHLLDPLIQVERLTRYLRKFHAFDQQRFVMLRWRQIVPVALAMLVLEFSRGRPPSRG